ncbi:ABC transporter permease [Xenophilus sp. Marseille-Q4582]|uniref:ABC transporter permease n=1 Tax=Xenophilus sp. Marseille-Q4582 TaxID=2866600 RepID=UPI001CE3E720|nr:ABC transporter permease [Xenophilus sp. Marseille-Q4582]
MLAALIRKELLALVRDVHGLAVLFAMPAVFIVVMSLSLKEYYSPPLTTLRYALDLQDRGAPAQLVRAAWLRTHGDPQPLPADWREALRSGRLKYVVLLQPGLSEALEAEALPRSAHMQLLAEPGIDGHLLNALRAELVGAAGEVKGRLAFQVAGAPPLGGDGASMAALVQAERFAGGAVRPTAVQQNVPAWLVFAMFFVVASMAGLVVQERATGALGRLQSLGVPRGVMLASKALPYLGVNALQAALMLALGLWGVPALGGDRLSLAGVQAGALLAVLGAISLAAVGLALALACAVRTHAQAATAGPALNVVMAAIGGIMVPTFVMPEFMQRVAQASPMNWALEALMTVLLRGGGVADVAAPVGRLVLLAALLFALAGWLFGRRRS